MLLRLARAIRIVVVLIANQGFHDSVQNMMETEGPEERDPSIKVRCTTDVVIVVRCFRRTATDALSQKRFALSNDKFGDQCRWWEIKPRMVRDSKCGWNNGYPIVRETVVVSFLPHRGEASWKGSCVGEMFCYSEKKVNIGDDRVCLV